MSSIIKVLPLEIISLIIEDLGSDEHPSQSLKSCALSCQTFLPLCQKELFRKMSLLDDRTRSTFVELVRQSPRLAQHVRELAYAPKAEECVDSLDTDTSISALLHVFKKLRRITITFPGPRRSSFQDWQQLSPSLRSTLLSLLHLPLITSIRLRNIRNFDYFDLVPCTGLRELDLHEVLPVELGNAYSMLRSALPVKPIQLQRLKLTDQHPNEKKVVPSFTEISRIVKYNRNDSASVLDLAGLVDVAITQLVDLGIASNIIKRSWSLKSVVLGFSFYNPDVIID
ncbi:hypothetical protein JR316_0009896 [Psilocybe cubensis]|uniref:Uncharacterized protein n=1 Tax=Psilocybe cubensis TaxID=181762 RepID=A0ACB8GPL1_PSICU|nr:hypothetical protein JR316_0009896 [Psilocybe cubensis]KAH9477670.1 hypothetical protein JR316_0009896 [Psilocybe cubensis]